MNTETNFYHFYALALAFSELYSIKMDVLLSCILLLAMGLQNALVTKVSGSVVRTTHLTGLFTDLGIELSQMIFYKKPHENKRLKRAVFLKGIIIMGFFLGGIVGALLHKTLELKTLFIPIIILVVTLYYDRPLLSYYRLRRKRQDQLKASN